MNNSILEVSNVYTDRLMDISLSLEYGEILTIIGPSGAGKSSLLMLLNRLEEPLKGQISFKGKDIREYSILDLRRSIGLVFQSAALFDGTVEENLKYGPSLLGMWDKREGARLL